MKNSYILYSALFSLLLAIVFAFNDNLSELAGVFGAISIASFGFYVYRRTWKGNSPAAPSQPQPFFWMLKTSSVLTILGILVIGAGILGAFSAALGELMPLILAGALALILALILRIANGILAKRVDATTGGLSIATIVVLTVGLLTICLVIYIVYLLLAGLALI